MAHLQSLASLDPCGLAFHLFTHLAQHRLRQHGMHHPRPPRTSAGRARPPSTQRGQALAPCPKAAGRSATEAHLDARAAPPGPASRTRPRTRGRSTRRMQAGVTDCAAAATVVPDRIARLRRMAPPWPATAAAANASSNDHARIRRQQTGDRTEANAPAAAPENCADAHHQRKPARQGRQHEQRRQPRRMPQRNGAHALQQQPRVHHDHRRASQHEPPATPTNTRVRHATERHPPHASASTARQHHAECTSA